MTTLGNPAALCRRGGDPKAYIHYPVMSQVQPPDQRTPHRRMIDLANGYFSTLQLNDGKVLTAFTDDCERQENGFESAGNPKFDRPEGKLFHITAGKIDRVEVVHITVPYGAPSVWRHDAD